MLFGLICLTWFDAITVALTFAAIVLIQVLIATFVPTTNTTTTTARTPTSESSSTVQTTTNGKIQKQKSEHCEDLSSAATSVNSTPTSSSRNSISSLHNGLHSVSSHPPSPDTLSDDYHEDEDTLSLENLFPCDQTEIYASKKINYIIDELIQTEMNYVTNLQKGLRNYGNLASRPDVPEPLQGADKRQQLLGNIEDIWELHEKQILPMMLRNQRDLKQLFDEFAAFFDKNNFYSYVIFTMNKKTSMQLRQEHREWFQNVQNEIHDKLGIDSFLVQPIQRLTRYPLLLQQFISEFYKSGISCKPVLMSLCKLETRMRRLLEVVNQAEEIPNIDEIAEPNLLQNIGNFCKSTEFDAYHYRSRKKYRAKVFLFDQCLLCTEVRKRRLAYRQHYDWDLIELQLNTSKSIKLFLKATDRSGVTKEEMDFNALEAISVKEWMRSAKRIVQAARIEASQRGKFTLPMDLVLGMAIAIWLIWHYL